QEQSRPWRAGSASDAIESARPAVGTAKRYWCALPGDPHYRPGFFPFVMPQYFCAEDEARTHGYHHEPCSMLDSRSRPSCVTVLPFVGGRRLAPVGLAASPLADSPGPGGVGPDAARPLT